MDYAVIDFTDAPLGDVVKDIERIYGVKISNIPTETYSLTLHYEGDASELVTIINELLNINLQIEDTNELKSEK